MLTVEQQESIIAEAMEQMKSQLVASAISSVEFQIKQRVADATKAEVDAFFLEEVAPDIRLALVSNKEAIIKAAVVAANDMAETLAKEMSAELAERLGNSWSRKKIFDSMFGG